MNFHFRSPSLSFAIVITLAACTPSAQAPEASTPVPGEAASASTSVNESSSALESSAAPTGNTPTPSKQGPVGAMCGGIAGFGCATGLFCDFALEAHCGAADQSGVCKPVPEMCTQQYDPVCGCNDRPYANACFAAREGIAVAALGECAGGQQPSGEPQSTLAEGQLCGTRGVVGACADGLYCKYKSACGATDSGGSCVARPHACTKIYKPVCGCDGKTYSSDCVAASQGVDVASAGACPEQP